MHHPKTIYEQILNRHHSGKKSFAVLLDPDKCEADAAGAVIAMGEKAEVDYFFVGGSLMVTQRLDELVMQIKANCDIPVILFPGSPGQISTYADALLYLSLISGRNPELLIGQHVVSAPLIKQSGLEVMSTGYMVVDGGAPTTVSYISGSNPIPSDKNDIAVCTAMAGEMLGMKLIYLDAGSGAKRPVSESMISQVAGSIQIPLIVGGGITDPEKAFQNCKAGADIVVVGNALEKDPTLLSEMAAAIHSVSVYR
jgi:putative glycerol-1-phosphate prenyltransferase